MLGVADADEVSDFLRAHQRRLSRLAMVLAGRRDLAEDLVQDAMVKIVSHWHRVRGSGDPLAYASRILINQWRDTGRRLTRGSAAAAEARALGELESAEGDVLDRLTMAAAMTRLTAKQRAVLYLRFYEDLPVRDVARIMGCSEGNVKSQTAYALQQLSKLLPGAHEWGIR